MPPDNQPNYYWQMIGVLLISAVSGFISVGRRILKGTPPPIVWVVTEFCAALLAGYLAWDAYPTVKDDLPSWMTMPVFVALCAHFGGRFFQHAETLIETKLQRPDSPGK